MMLDYLGFANESRQLVFAIERVYSEGKFLTPDQGGDASTSAFTRAVFDFL